MEALELKNQALQPDHSQEWYDEQFENIIVNQIVNSATEAPVSNRISTLQPIYNTVYTATSELYEPIDNLDSFFDDDAGTVIDDLDFDGATLRAANDISDTEASLLIVAGMEKAAARGDFDQLRQMAMTLGAVACIHDHMQTLASKAESLLGLNTHENHNGHTHDQDDESNHTSTRKKKKKKSLANSVKERKRLSTKDIHTMLKDILKIKALPKKP